VEVDSVKNIIPYHPDSDTQQNPWEEKKC